ncbi:MAG: coproporphyrinogen III oxidase, partial [Solibacillus sp.]
MKAIYIKEQYKEDWHRVFNHIANLFYEDSIIQLEHEGSDMSLQFGHSTDTEHTIRTSAKLEVEGQTYTSQYSIGYSTEGTDKEQNIRMKRALSHVMLDVLEQYSGMTQQWGIL